MPLKYTKSQITKVKFSGVEKGYDPLEVDEFLDGVVTDYEKFERLEDDFRSLSSSLKEKEKRILAQEKRITSLKTEVSQLEDEKMMAEAELSCQKSRIESALKEVKNLSDLDTMIGYLNYISVLETELAHLGGDVAKCKAMSKRKSIHLTQDEK